MDFHSQSSSRILHLVTNIATFATAMVISTAYDTHNILLTYSYIQANFWLIDDSI